MYQKWPCGYVMKEENCCKNNCPERKQSNEEIEACYHGHKRMREKKRKTVGGRNTAD
jgi:hypothetical protein